MALTVEEWTERTRSTGSDIEDLASGTREIGENLENLVAQMREAVGDIEDLVARTQDAADKLDGDVLEWPQCNMEPEVFAARMHAASVYDAETARDEAARLMCGLLRDLGYDEGVRVFENLIKDRRTHG